MQHPSFVCIGVEQKEPRRLMEISDIHLLHRVTQHAVYPRKSLLRNIAPRRLAYCRGNAGLICEVM